jgi:hypothetical protein
MRRPHPRSLTPLALVLASAFTPAWATPVLGASSSAMAAGTTGTPNTQNQPSPPSPYATSGTSVYEAAGNAQGSAFANGNGAYASGSSAEGQSAAGTARAMLTYSLTNAASTAMQYSMSFYIYSGRIESQLRDPAGLSGNEMLGASYSARISVGGVTRFSSGASLQVTENGYAWGKTGTDLNIYDDGNDGYYSWGGNSFNIDLGVLAAGETLEIVAELDTGVLSDVGTYDYNCGGGYGYGGYGYGGGGTCTDFKGRSSAFYGDPSIFEGSELPEGPVTFTASAVNGVPEPGSLLLASLGLCAATASRRRRKAPEAVS